MDREFLTAAEVAEMFSCHTETVKRRARTGELPAFKFGRSWFFPKSELIQAVEGWIEKGRQRRARRNS